MYPPTSQTIKKCIEQQLIFPFLMFLLSFPLCICVISLQLPLAHSCTPPLINLRLDTFRSSLNYLTQCAVSQCAQNTTDSFQFSFFLCFQACQSCPLFHIHSQAQGTATLSFLLHLKQFPCTPPLHIHAHPGDGTVQQIQFNCSFCWSPAFGSHSASIYSELLTKTYLHIFCVCVLCVPVEIDVELRQCNIPQL